MRNATAVQASAIAAFLGSPLLGPDLSIDRVRPAARPEPGSLLFLNPGLPDLTDPINLAVGLLVLAAPEYEQQLTVSRILTPHPRRDFARVLQQFFAPPRPQGIAGTAQIAPTARLGQGVSVGAYSIIGDYVQIGDGTEIRDHVVIREGSVIGKDCLIRSHTVIGEEGFGFEPDADGTHIRIPHFGRVLIGDRVEIGAGNAIARGTIDDTVLADGVKTDDHVFIAHNVSVGENTLIAGCSGISGSAKVGRNVWIGFGALVMGHLEVGDDALVGIGATVIKPVPPGAVVTGNPARVLGPRTR